VADVDLSGLRVLLVGPAEASLVQATADAFGSSGARVSPVGDGVADDVAALAAELGGLDVCVCFARATAASPLIETEDVAWEEALARQLLAPRRAAMAAARVMGAGSGGSIVLVGSVDAFHAYPGRSAAAVAMGGLLGLARSLAVELASVGIRANLVVAGPLGSPDGGPPAGADPALVERTLLRSPVRRFASPDEVAAAIRFVAGPDAAFMTGQTLRVDGGWASLNQSPEGMRFP
jgi:3-oxoacyl-[acyl-carrier protein] reductase